MSLTLDDLRQPSFGARVWGYDRDEVDQLLASVVVSIERLQRRRQRDGEAIERATGEAQRAGERAKRAERQRDELASRIELADQAVAEANLRAQRLVAQAEERAQRLVAQAEERATRAERARLARDTGSAARDGVTELPSGVTGEAPASLGEEGDSNSRLPLALRAARALLADARARAAAIDAEATGDGDSLQQVGLFGHDPLVERLEGEPAGPVATDLAGSEAGGGRIDQDRGPGGLG